MAISGPHHLQNIHHSLDSCYVIKFFLTETRWNSLQHSQFSKSLKTDHFYLVDDTRFFHLAAFDVCLLS